MTDRIWLTIYTSTPVLRLDFPAVLAWQRPLSTNRLTRNLAFYAFLLLLLLNAMYLRT